MQKIPLTRTKSTTKREKTTSEKENYALKKEDMASHRSKAVKGTKKDKFQVPVAVFDEQENPNQKSMYPKHLVYIDGKDIQLEEIRAMNYWNKIKAGGIAFEKGIQCTHQLPPETKKIFRDVSTQTEAEILPTEIQKVQLIENYTQTESNNVSVKETSAQTSFYSTHKSSQTDSPNLVSKNNLAEKQIPKTIQSTNEISIQTTTPISSPIAAKKNIPSIGSKTLEAACADIVITPPTTVPPVDKRYETIVIDKCEEKRDLVDFKSFIRGSGGMLPNMEHLDDENDTIVDTRAFKVLPSSTPFHTNKKINIPEDENTMIAYEPVDKNESVHLTKSHVNLSMIVELSKEIYSQSTTASKIEGINSKTFTIPNHRVIDQNDDTDSDNFNLRSISNPFDDNVIQHLLLSVSFPTDNHLTGYSHFDSDVPILRSRSTIKLGPDKFTVSGEIGEGAYARILKIQPDYNAHKSMALKHQEPPCLWEWYINKEIFNRLIDKDKLQYFIEYSKIYVFKNASLILSDWAPYGNILNLLNVLKNAKNLVLKDRCPMSVCVHLSIQMISSIQYLHSCEIIHGDVKPDNFVLVPCSSNTSLRVKLIDFGRSIDMKLFPPGKTFNYVVSTENFTCNEMKEQKPWTYQTDLFGLAGTMYILLVGKYMVTQKRDGAWVFDKALPRYYHPDIWMPIFHNLLNIPSCNVLPNLSDFRKILDEFFSNKIGKFTLSREMNNVLSVLNKK
ncbi:mitotic checkpoint serine/threonine-protein kinase BUB1-like [Planococcus citri]|uniref:mitotic checkpoint serine/threonine-protein kinase BUB1-like n=1 Tax=Planococcus citri TaxID=170843 RepID=UPI0031F9E2A8